VAEADLRWNAVKATLKALQQLESPEQVARRRGLPRERFAKLIRQNTSEQQ